MLAHRYGTHKHCGTKQAAFDGQGGIQGSGRWHYRGNRIVYTAAHQSLALLEILVHLDASNSLQPLVAWVLNIPDCHIEHPRDLPAGWTKDIELSRAYGTAWLESKRSVCLAVRSIIVPDETNILINPAHPAFDLSWVLNNTPNPVPIDPRLVS